MKIDNPGYNFTFNNKVKSKNENATFEQLFKSALDSVNEAQIKADEETNKMVTGQTEDIHQVLVAAEEARIQMELTIQVRNKLLESYQEISRMQI